MAPAQLAISKIPAIDNEPMVDNFKILRLFQAYRYLSETTVRGLWSEGDSKRLSLRWRETCPSRSLA